MSLRFAWHARMRALVLALGVGASALTAATVHAAGGPAEPASAVTAADVAASNEKVKMAYAALVTMWTGEFRGLGQRFAVPGLARYRGAVRTGCGVQQSGNAVYCPTDNAIYYDDVFVAVQAKRAARRLGTDGDMAAIGIIAHEMGHAVAMQLGHLSRFTYENEATADCLAGAFARQADRDGSLEPGDVEEAFFAMATAGDPTPVLTGDRRVDRVILTRATLMGHGTDAQRTQNFGAGLQGGPAACF